MAADTPQIVTLFLFFIGVGLCMWRAPQADRWHAVLCTIAGMLWCIPPLLDPRARTARYASVAATLLIIGLLRSWQRRRQLRIDGSAG
jgi:hypothetical protein